MLVKCAGEKIVCCRIFWMLVELYETYSILMGTKIQMYFGEVCNIQYVAYCMLVKTFLYLGEKTQNTISYIFTNIRTVEIILSWLPRIYGIKKCSFKMWRSLIIRYNLYQKTWNRHQASELILELLQNFPCSACLSANVFEWIRCARALYRV